jgi:hypothetical protein
MNTAIIIILVLLAIGTVWHLIHDDDDDDYYDPDKFA